MNIDEIKSRKEFWGSEFDLDRADKMLEYLIGKCSLKEILWIARNVVYDQVAYYNQNSKGIVYNGEYSDLNVEQANRLQQQISTLLDLFSQSVNSKREFDEDYLKSYEFAGPYLRIIESLKSEGDN